MSTLWLIRHGQASFAGPSYDVLSERGVAQSRRLGSWLAAAPVALDALYTGPRRRQIDTARHLVEAARAAGAAYPEATVLEEFDEYPWEAIARRGLPSFVEAGGPGDFQRGLELLMARWVRGELDLGGEVESFASFAARVERGLAEVRRRVGRGRRVAVVTSAGPISVSLRVALSLGDDATLRAGWVVANSSLTEFRFREDELTLVSFNAVPHLGPPEVTYR